MIHVIFPFFGQWFLAANTPSPPSTANPWSGAALLIVSSPAARRLVRRPIPGNMTEHSRDSLVKQADKAAMGIKVA
ncbi:MAG: hypothetical protein PHO07_00205 [Pirellulales bacterium]|nr:hypothetical protein [Thermoguttaceae bacterium]MDD4785566.1 hypothetical protein [Pirellulales bacterium]MDI9445390.1 hypothetical protein [Planctomycetota bacterium]NLZ00619.1 hypothetical protein [Pirellulaceae bacterium]